MKRVGLLGVLLLLTAAGASQDKHKSAAHAGKRGAAQAPSSDLSPITVAATPVPLSPDDPAMTRIGRLRYMGGLQLKSSDPRFGGLSALRWQSPGHLISITDGGQWVTLDVHEESGRLVGLDGVSVGIVRGPAREPLKGKAHVDAEALELDGDGGLTVAFETEPRIWHYRGIGGAASSEEFPDPDWLNALPKNRGIEAMAHLPGAWLYLGEAVTPQGYNEGVLAPTESLARTHVRVKLKMPGGYVPTDAQALDPGQVLVVGRRFSIAAGMSAIVAVVPVDLKAMALGAPMVLATLDPPLSVDNMEGLAIAREGGRTFVYLCSDDNFSPIQRTLLLKFELLPE